MTDLLKAIVLGLIEGLTEFLPVSSTGHMIVTMPLLGVNEAEPRWKVFLYFVQIGAILAVILYFRRQLFDAVRRRPANGWSNHLLVKLAVASVPAAAIGLPLDKIMERYLETPIFVGCALVVGAGVMEWIERRCRRDVPMTLENVSLRQAFLIGLAQCVSIIPGTSRAMATIMGGLLVGLSASVATEFSFFLAIPTLLGAGMLRLVKHRASITPDSATLLGVGFAVAFVSALFVIDGFLRYVRTRRLRPFAIYRVVLGVAVLMSVWINR